MAESVHVFVANRPTLIRGLLLTVEGKRPDFLIVAIDNSGPRPLVCDVLLAGFPNTKIPALARQRNSSVFCSGSLDIHSLDVEASEDDILGAILSGSVRKAQ